MNKSFEKRFFIPKDSLVKVNLEKSMDARTAREILGVDELTKGKEILRKVKN